MEKSMKKQDKPTARLRAALVGGKSLTATQIKAKFRLANPSASVHQLRQQGLDIVSSEGKYSL